MYVTEDFTISGKTVLLRGTHVRGADPATFQHLSGPWSRDRRSIFWSVFRRAKIDPDTFQPLNCIWGVDRHTAYPASGKPLVGVDPKTFRAFDAGVAPDGLLGVTHPLNAGFAGDDHRVFFHAATYPSGWEVKKVDASTFVPLGYRYARDAKAVFYEQNSVKKADPRSFFVINRFYAADDTSVFFAGRRIEGADPRSFVLLWDTGGISARDRHHYYSGDHVIDRSKYLESLHSDIKSLQETAANVASGAYDEYYRACMVDYRA